MINGVEPNTQKFIVVDVSDRQPVGVEPDEISAELKPGMIPALDSRQHLPNCLIPGVYGRQVHPPEPWSERTNHATENVAVRNLQNCDVARFHLNAYDRRCSRRLGANRSPGCRIPQEQQHGAVHVRFRNSTAILAGSRGDQVLALPSGGPFPTARVQHAKACRRAGTSTTLDAPPRLGRCRALSVKYACGFSRSPCMDKEGRALPSHCPACEIALTDSTHVAPISEVAHVNYHRCPKCGHVWTTTKDNRIILSHVTSKKPR